jgi:hypothetical protein
MKRKVMTCLIATVLLTACGGSSVSTPDPEGTVSTTLANGNFFTLYSGVAADGPYSCTRTSCPYVRLRFEFQPSFLTTLFETDISPTSVFSYGSYDITRDAGAEAADLGKVGGLGDVTGKPNSGYGLQTTLLKGHGYVLRFRHSRDVNNTGLPYFYYRVYVADWMTSAVTGGVNGVILRIQGPF